MNVLPRSSSSSGGGATITGRRRRTQRRRPARATAASARAGTSVLLFLSAFIGIWLLLLFAVLHNHVTDNIKGLHVPKVQWLRRRRQDTGYSGSTVSTTNDKNDKKASTGHHASSTSAPKIYHACTCLNSTTLSSFTNNLTHPYASPLSYGFEWLHIPKTGSSFAATLWSFACTRRGYIDLSISNDVGGSQSLPWSKNFIFHDMYEQALTARYPSEIYCHRDVIGSESIGHRPVTRDNVLDFNVVGFFRQPEERLGSAFDHGLHSTGFRNKTDLYQHCRYPEPGNFTCFATYPGIAGCQTRMLTGGECASHQYVSLKPPRIQGAIENMQDMAFVGLTEEWGESICQFHKTFGGIPQQGQFGNIHPGHRHTRRDELGGWHDVADTALYRAAVEEFERRRGPGRCYKVISADSMDMSMINKCVPKKCADMGKQCGEWPDGCGGYVVCGVCNPSMDGLPSFWSARCDQEGQCLRICPGWEDAGLLLSNSTYSPVDIIHTFRSLGAPVDSVYLEMLTKNLKFISPLDAIRICTEACHGPNFGSPAFASKYCACGGYPQKFLEVSPTWEDFQNAHELKPILDPNQARVLVHDNGKIITHHPIATTAHLRGNATRPRCCNPLPRRTRGQLPPHEDWLPGTIHADFFETVDLGCGAHDACEKVGHDKGATVVVYNRITRKCHLGENEGFDVPASEAFSKREYLLI